MPEMRMRAPSFTLPGVNTRLSSGHLYAPTSAGIPFPSLILAFSEKFNLTAEAPNPALKRSRVERCRSWLPLVRAARLALR